MQTPAIALSCLLFTPVVAAGQAAGASAESKRWEIEVFGGAALPNPPSSGTAVTLPPGPPLPTSSPIFPSRQISSWFFGDGALLLNDVNAAFGVAARLAPLETGLTTSGLDRQGEAAAGVRLRRALSSRVALEVGIDTGLSGQDLSDGIAAAAEASRQTFEAALRGLLASGPFSNVNVTATRTVNEGSARELFITAALNVHLGQLGLFEPYLTAGGGIARSIGSGARTTLEGRYRFSILGTFPIDETDRLTLRAQRETTPVAVVGAGLKRGLSDRWALRIDGRVLIGPGSHRVVIDAAPSSAAGSPGAFVESFTHPSVQFSNDPGTGRLSSLSGPRVEDLEVFRSEGIGTRVLVTVGLAARF